MRKVPHLTGIFPLHDLRKGICTGYKEKFGIWTQLPDIAQRIDSIGDPRTVDIYARHNELRIRCCCDNGHEITVFCIRYIRIKLEYRPSCGDKNHFIQIIYPGNFRCCNKMPVMDRVKSAAHDADSGDIVPVPPCRKPFTMPDACFTAEVRHTAFRSTHRRGIAGTPPCPS